MGVSTRVYTMYGVLVEPFNAELSAALWETEDHAALRAHVVGDAMGGVYTVIGRVLFDSGDSRWEPMAGFEIIDLKSLFSVPLEVRAAFRALPQFLPLLDAKWQLMTFVHCS